LNLKICRALIKLLYLT